MKRALLFIFSLAASCIIAAAQSTPAAPQGQTPTGGRAPLPQEVFSKQPNPDELASAPRVSLADLKKLIDSSKVVIVDVRGLDSYKTGHIPGAISVPLIDIPTRGKELAGKKTVVTYCS
ncbi:MAG TPA: rhodanese-like domain-containing protein [Acidobacteriota bacterium]|jgi:3-mercaptopyruvate sulfurtransferase SseA